MTGNPFTWDGFGQWTHLGGAFSCVLLAVWMWQRERRDGIGGHAKVLALAISAAWLLVVSVMGAMSGPAQLFETLRNLAWLATIYQLFARDGRHESMRPVRPVLAALVFVELMQPVLLFLTMRFGSLPGAAYMIFHLSVMFRLLVVTGALVLVHNLYAGTMPALRGGLRWTCVALALLWGYDLNYYTVGYLDNVVPRELSALRGLAAIAFSGLLAAGSLRGRADMRFSPSRTVAFQSLSLLVIGLYLIVMVGAAESLSWMGGDVGQLTQLGFAFAMTVLCLLALPSGRLRSWLKVTVSKHFFQHRYDYRSEWQRFTRTIGRGGTSALPLHERVVQAVADITDSSSGLLLVTADRGELVLASRWQWRTIDVPAEAMPPQAATYFERDGFIVDLDELRAGTDHRGETAIVPRWLVDDDSAWALVPLLHFDRLVGLVVLGRPAVARKLDWEDFDLLRVVGQQLASYLAEHAGQVALLEASRFDEFNRRIAFVMHDIKNLASQLSLLSRNAERHADNPAFRSDMLVTLHSAADKLNTLLARLSRYGSSAVARFEQIDPSEVARSVATRYVGPEGPQVYVTDRPDCAIVAHRETLEQVLMHLIQNAIDASQNGMPVIVTIGADGLHGCIEVIDTGCGMSAEFVRNKLFKPFVSTKPGGFGIGAFEARELVKAMRGRLDVESREGLGSRFVVRLPLVVAADLLETIGGPHGHSASQKVA
ncbi:XrtA/PEP-CTERM system histidine kinase PrsK [Novosphingobium lentum]|uniref:XrtA/PEP-CTERM system histidine kinase PrsK n=1 Tax=Novosphingobium lentum TaxID=145287 RepID=UPI000836B98C|nr:XrtA/PEP-CTERM system histidine kinase PrsK [Novosphingobium lentum]